MKALPFWVALFVLYLSINESFQWMITSQGFIKGDHFKEVGLSYKPNFEEWPT